MHRIFRAFLEEGLLVHLRRMKNVRYKHLLFDLPVIVGAFYVALWLKYGSEEFLGPATRFTHYLPIFVGIYVITFVGMGVYNIFWRYISIGDVMTILRATTAAFVLSVVGTYLMGLGHKPRITLMITGVLQASALIGIRIFRRYLYEYPTVKKLHRTGRPTLIYGAGHNGVSVAQRLLADPELENNPIGFVDDDRGKSGKLIAGLKVLGTSEDLEQLVDHYKVRELILAIAKPSGKVLRDVLQVCQTRGIQPRLIKVTNSDSSPGAAFPIVREIELDDLLSRERRFIDLGDLKENLSDKCVLVTGAGGSIGSELARQIFKLNPARLLLLDHSEFNLYEVDKQLRGDTASTRIIPLLIDIKNFAMLEGIFQKYRPDVVFHAAAYKHVHLVEANPLPAILNNIAGTKNLVDLAVRYAAKGFILISTDKAVNPGGVMGATKRVCELLVSGVGEATGRRFVSVRFGNVLGSSGSLIPRLSEQIRQGKPVTVTHPDMKRYFMLIPEAVALVLRASSLAKSGDIMVLKMGASVKIVDLARNLILIMGKHEEEIPIVFTGMRPGEKLEEELYLTGAEVETEDPDVLVVPKGDSSGQRSEKSYQLLQATLEKIIRDAQAGSPEATRAMWQLVKQGVSEHAELEEILVPENWTKEPTTWPTQPSVN